MEQTQALVAMVSSPGMGHIIPLAEFAKLLVSRFNFSVSLLLLTTAQPNTAQTTFLNSLPVSISHTFLPPIDPAHLPTGVAHSVTISHVHAHSLSSVRAALGSLAQRAHVVALVTDLFGTDLFSVARELNIRPYMYFTSTAMCLLFLFHLPMLDETVSCEYRDLSNPLTLPGCVPLNGEDFDEPTLDRKSLSYTLQLERVKRYKFAAGIFVNTFLDLELGAIRALQTEDPTRTSPPIYPIGPIIQWSLGEDANCLSWLDRQPFGSVLFVCFGSGGTLTTEQLNELAIGLERSGLRFLWVVRSPNDHSSSGSFFTAQSGDHNPLGFLPHGFVDRIKDRGLLLHCWAPQIKVLSHGSIGGFLTHCGWNSILESVVYGVPLIAWPLYAEQRMNAVMLHEGLKVALRPNTNENGLVVADEIAKVVNDLMEGEQGKMARHNMKELSELAKRATSENGDSSKSLEEVALSWIKSTI